MSSSSDDSFRSSKQKKRRCDLEDSEKKKRRNEAKEAYKDGLTFTGSGSKLVQHGIVYQLNMLMHFALRGVNVFKKFRLGTELAAEAAKFEDIIFTYQQHPTSKWRLRLLQIKHEEPLDSTAALTEIKENDLFNADGAFSIQKCFKSYLDIKRRCEIQSDYSIVSDCEINDLILLTNRCFESGLTKYFRTCDLESDELLRLGQNRNEAKMYQIVDPFNNDLVRKFIPIFHYNSDFYELIENLVSVIFENKKFDKKTAIFKEYFYPIIMDLLDIERDGCSARLSLQNDSPFIRTLIEELTFIKLFDKFQLKFGEGFETSEYNSLNSTEELAKGLADTVKNGLSLHSVFVGKLEKFSVLDIRNKTFDPLFIYGKIKKGKKGDKEENFDIESKVFRREFIRNLLTDEQKKTVKDEMEWKIINISKGVSKGFIPKKEIVIQNVAEFAQQMQKLILDNTQTKIIKITEETPFCIIKNLQMLSGYLLAEKSKKIRFCSSFLYSDELPGNLKEFKEIFSTLLGEDFEEIYQYEFKMEGYKFDTCEDGSLCRKLPVVHNDTEVYEFFHKFKFIVNYPKRKAMNDLLVREIEEKYQLSNAELFYSNFYKIMHDWLTNRMVTFLTHEKLTKIFDDIQNKFSLTNVEGITNSYFNYVSDEFHFENCDYFTEFLCSSNQVLLIRTENFELTRNRIVHTFRNLHRDDSEPFRTYTRKYAHVFLFSKQLVHVKARSDILNLLRIHEELKFVLIECNGGHADSKLCKPFLDLIRMKTSMKVVLVANLDIFMDVPDEINE